MKVKMGDGSLNLKAGGSLANIDRGPRGYSAYEVAVQNGFVGSEAAWLASLVGPKGDTGATGERGVQGPRGQQGEKGDTGATGATGPSNVLSIGTVTKGDEADATITGTSPEQVLNLVLPKGDKGDTGDTGAAGADGYTPVKGVDYFTADDIASLNIPDSTSDLTNDSGYITKSVNDLTNYYSKSSTYTKTETDTLLSAKQATIDSSHKLSSDLVDDTNKSHKFVSSSEKTTWNSKYDKPSGGIPKTDLDSSVQTSLGLADSAIQSHQDITGKEDKFNKVTSLSSSSTDAQYPSAKCVYDSQEAQNTVIGSKANSSDVYSKSEVYTKTETDTLLNGKQNTLTFDTTPTENSTNPVTSSGIYNSQAEQNTQLASLNNLVDQLPVVSGTGTDISLQDVLNYRFRKLDIFGNASQFSTTGKNLMDTLKTSVTTKGVTITPNLDGSLTITGTTTGDINQTLINSLNPPVLEAGTYTRSIKVIGTINKNGKNVLLTGRDIDFTNTMGNITINAGSTTSKTSILTEEHTMSNIGLYVDGAGVEFNCVCYIQIETGSSVTSYEPYTGGIPAPNPSYPYPIKVVTGENSVKVENKNKLNWSNCIQNRAWTESGQLTTNSACWACSEKQYTNASSLTFSADFTPSSGTQGRIYQFNSNDTLIVNTAITTFPTTINLNVNCAYYVYYFVNNMVAFNSKLQLEKGSIATAYVEHQEQNYTLNLGSLELAKIPNTDYEDYIYGTPNNWYKKQVIGKVTLNGEEGWNMPNSSSYPHLFQNLSSLDFINSTNNGLCNYFTWIDSNTVRTDEGFSLFYSSGNKYMRINNQNISDLTTFTSWLSTNKPVIYYILNTPTDIQITDTTLINQLNNIYNNDYSYNGVTNISSSCASGNEQMIFEASALLDLNSLVTRIQLIESEV